MSGIKLSAHDRLAMIAPHPDDESLAAGGLIQRAVAAGAGIRIFFVTDGDNNPWPQRVIERKWRIGGEDRRRWGNRRRNEAIAALARLGVPASAAQFFGMPDQGLTECLLRNEGRIGKLLVKGLEQFQPTLLLVPAPFDLHPDHNALSVLTRLALDLIDSKPAARTYSYIVHSKGRHSKENRLSLHLHSAEAELKREAILEHGSQMVLSRKRFLAYAKRPEIFYKQAPAARHDTHHPIEAAEISCGALRLKLRLSPGRPAGRNGSVLVAIESMSEGGIRWRVPLPKRSGRVHIRDAATGKLLRMASVRINGGSSVLNLPVSSLMPLRRIFVKFERPGIFLDLAGWREVPAETPTSSFNMQRRLAGPGAEMPVQRGAERRESVLAVRFLGKIFRGALRAPDPGL